MRPFHLPGVCHTNTMLVFKAAKGAANLQMEHAFIHHLPWLVHRVLNWITERLKHKLWERAEQALDNSTIFRALVFSTQLHGFAQADIDRLFREATYV